MRTLDIAWLGGLLEGEGYFTSRNGSPSFKIDMTDVDTLTKAADLFRVKTNGPRQPKGKPTYRPIWSCSVHGYRAVGWMMTVYQFLGARRQEAVRAAIRKWNSAPGFARKVRGADGKALPALCHPDRPRHARQLCRQCYGQKYMRQWRSDRKAKAA
jgi:hypothetical protein